MSEKVILPFKIYPMQGKKVVMKMICMHAVVNF